MQPPTDPLYPPNSPAIEGLDPQEDEWPQNLILTTYPVPGDPLSFAQPYGRRVHELFCGRTRPITVFPDHMHEGQLILPNRFLTSVWPQRTEGQPRPEVVARGTDKRNGRVYDLVMAYEGSSAGAGRIVADSTWHHDFNVNLKGFPGGGYVLAALAQFYANLAVWLSPPAKRWQIACWLRWKLVHNPNVLMTYGNSRMALGRVAAGVLRKTAGPCVIREVLEPLAFASAGRPARRSRSRRRSSCSGGLSKRTSTPYGEWTPGTKPHSRQMRTRSSARAFARLTRITRRRSLRRRNMPPVR